MARLGVNIDHVATLRQQRGEIYPSLSDAAKIALDAGADQITIHLREDRRHIQDFDIWDVKKVTDAYNVPLNFEIGANDEIVNIAMDLEPAWLCLVPEKREERTTEGGLNLLNNSNRDKIYSVCQKFKDKKLATNISLFVEADKKILGVCNELPIEAVEIHTGDYAMAFNKGENLDKYFHDFREAREFLNPDIGFHAGHGLTDLSLAPLCERNLFVEYNIGHWIVCDAVFNGLHTSVKKLIDIIQRN